MERHFLKISGHLRVSNGERFEVTGLVNSLLSRNFGNEERKQSRRAQRVRFSQDITNEKGDFPHCLACRGRADRARGGCLLWPILIALPAPSSSDVQAAAGGAEFSGQFRRDLKESDALHWGEGTVFAGREAISLQGAIAPGLAYQLYLSPEFVETQEDFTRLRSKMARVGSVKTFENFIVAVPAPLDPSAYNTVVVWCESFSQFITAARYR